jgi:tetratricopeptide (TPR) repeat protein
MALMSKAMVVTLPFVLLLLDYWPLGRLKIPPADNRGGVSAARLIYEKLPLFAMSAAVSVVTFMLQNEVHAVHTLESVTPAMRLYNSLFSHAAYIGTALWPSGLAIVHPYEIISASKAAASAALLLAISLAAAWRVKKEPYIIVGWLWFLGTLFPVNGLVQVGQHARSDRYMYLPSAGLYIMAVWALSHLAGRWKNGRLMLSAAAVVVVAALGMASWTELHYWRDNITLFKRSIELNKNNPIAYANLALALQKKGFKDEAIKNFEEAVRLKPNYPLAHHALGAILQDKGRTDEAIAHFAESIRLNPDDAYPRVRLGLALLGKGAVEDAGREFSEAMRIEPQNEYAHYNLGVVLNQKGRPEDAAREFEAAVRFKPDYAEALYNLGVATAARGRMEEAASYFSRAAAVNPSDEKAVFNLGVTLANMGKPTEAIRCFQEALRLKPDFAQARQYLNQLQINTGYGQ